MADRKVTKTGKGENKVITKLCNTGEYWSPRYKNDTVKDIENKVHTYYTTVDGSRAEVYVFELNGEKHLSTDPDGRGKNNLEGLPDC